MKKFALILFSLPLLFCGCQTVETVMGGAESLDLTGNYWQEAICGWTPETPAREKNKPRVDRNVTGGKLRVGGLTFDKGIGLAGKSYLFCSPKGYVANLEMLVGVDDSTPANNPTAHFAVYGDGKELFSADLRRAKEPTHCKISLSGVDELMIAIDAPSNVFVDILIPAFYGLPGLKNELIKGQKYYENFVFAQPKPLKSITFLSNDAIAFPVKNKKFGDCIGMSNDYLCVIVSPGHAGKVIHFGSDINHNYLAGTSGVMLHPLNRRIADLSLAYNGTWKWKFDEDGVLKLLSPPDLPHGIRWMKTFYLLPDSKVMKATVHLKNVTRDDVSWSAGTYFDAGTNFIIALKAEQAEPGYTFQKSPPENIVKTDDMLLLSDYKTGKFLENKLNNYDVITSAAGWFCVLSMKKKQALFVNPIEPRNGLFPYGGARVFVVRSPDKFKITTLSELTPLGPKESFSQTQYWTIDNAVKDMKTTVSTLKKLIGDTVNSDSGLGVPTGRTLTNH